MGMSVEEIEPAVVEELGRFERLVRGLTAGQLEEIDVPVNIYAGA